MMGNKQRGFLSGYSIKNKLILFGVIISAFGLILFGIGMTATEMSAVKTNILKELNIQAKIIGDNTTAALTFDDPKSATETLSALKANTTINYCILYTKEGKPFATYSRVDEHKHPLVPFSKIIPNHFGLDYVSVYQEIILDGKVVGGIYIQSNLDEIYSNLLHYSLFVLIALFSALLGSYAVSKRLQKSITKPIIQMVELMQTVSKEKNYTVRTPVESHDELGMLATGFNEMLTQIQLRDTELARHREDLEQEVAQRTAKLTEAQHIAHLGNWEWDIANNKLNWSDEIYHIFGLTPQQFGATYEAFLQAVYPEDRKLVDTRVRETLEQGRTCSIDHRILLPHGTVRYVHEQGEVFHNNDGVPVRMVGTVQDITEAKLAEEKIRKLNENLEAKVKERTQQLLEAQEELVRKEKLSVLGQVAGSVGHELRNPLGVMSNAVYFLQTVLPDADESVKEYLDIIKHEIAGSEKIVSDLLDSVRTKPPQPEAVGVAELIEQTLRKLDIPSVVTLNLEIPVTLPALEVDPQQIHQVFRNLISNGIEAMPDGGTLEIRAVADEEIKKIIISVRDSGIGMTPEHLEKLFQPLFTTKARGIGLGLVVVKNLTEANGGSVKVESDAGKGTVFTLTLPSTDKRKGVL